MSWGNKCSRGKSTMVPEPAGSSGGRGGDSCGSRTCWIIKKRGGDVSRNFSGCIKRKGHWCRAQMVCSLCMDSIFSSTASSPSLGKFKTRLPVITMFLGPSF